ncbi:MAG: SsrA-binding protein SmpB [Planctomycetota bacterium]|jgi:SsrA-binding protein
MKKSVNNDRSICRNKRATHKFELLEKIECGIVLMGSEVKSLRDRNASLEESYARIENGELWLINFHIASYKYATTKCHEPLRRKKLLVHGRQLRKIEPKLRQKGLTLVPLDAHFSERGIVKITIAIGKGKSTSDKRQDLKTREAKREMDRASRRR